jgi:hypothetical protein
MIHLRDLKKENRNQKTEIRGEKGEMERENE